MKEQQPELLEGLSVIALSQGTSLSTLSKEMGQASNYLRWHLKQGNPKVMLLVELSTRLNVNLLEAYLPLIPAAVRATEAEKQLALEKEALQKELEKVTAERDKYWGVIENRFR